MFVNPTAQEIASVLRAAKIIAVLGLSDDDSRPSYSVSRALQRFGYRIIPVNPTVSSVLGERAVASLDDIHQVLAPGEQVDIVDVFRRPEHVSAIVDDVIRLRFPALWLQDGVVDERAAHRAQDAGIFTVMNRCIYRDRSALG